MGDSPARPALEVTPLLPVPRAAGCTVCGGPVTTASWTQLPLLKHGGYGEASTSEVERCLTVGCGNVRQVAVTSHNPRTAGR